MGDHSPEALRDRAEAAEDRAYRLAFAIVGGEDAPGYIDSIPTDVLVRMARGAAMRAETAEEKVEGLQEALREIRDWRKSCHAYDRDMGHPLRDFDVEDLKLVEFRARVALGRED